MYVIIYYVFYFLSGEQKVTVTRKEISNYDQRQQDSVSMAVAASPDISPSPRSSNSSMQIFPSCFSSVSDSSWKNEDEGAVFSERPVLGRCYGCALATVEHCLIILKAFATVKETHQVMLQQV